MKRQERTLGAVKRILELGEQSPVRVILIARRKLSFVASFVPMVRYAGPGKKHRHDVGHAPLALSGRPLWAILLAGLVDDGSLDVCPRHTDGRSQGRTVWRACRGPGTAWQPPSMRGRGRSGSVLRCG